MSMVSDHPEGAEGQRPSTVPIPPASGPSTRDGRPTVAAFDFDGTLLAGDTVLILHRLVRGPLLMALDWLLLLPAALAWKSGRRSTIWFKEHVLRCILAACDPARRPSLLAEELPMLLSQRLRPEALARLEHHRRCGHRLTIISASPLPLLEPVARRLGVDLIATGMEGNDGALRLSTANCKGAEKVRRLESWLGQPLSRVRLEAYGDSRGDRELLEAADLPHWRSFTQEPHPFPRKRRSLPVQLLGLLLLLVLAWGLLRLPPTERSGLFAALARLPLWLPALYGVLAVSFGLRYCRWRLLLGGYGIGAWNRPDLLAWFRGFTLTATPGKLGELVRVHELHQWLGYPRAPLLHVFVWERAFDVLAVVVWLSVLAPGVIASSVARLPAGPPLETSAAAGLAGLLLGLLVLLLLAAAQPLRQLLHHLAGPLQRRRAPLLGATLAAALVSVLFWACEPLILWILVRALSPRTLPLGVTTAIYLLSGTAGMASSLPAGIGVNEAATVLLLGQEGIPAGIALPIAIIRRLLTPWSIVALASSIAPPFAARSANAASGPGMADKTTAVLEDSARTQP